MFLLGFDMTMLGGAGWELLKFLLPIVSSVLILVLSALGKKHVEKLGIERSERVDAMIDKYVEIGVNAAQRVATKKVDGRTLDRKDKMALATKTVLEELEQSCLKGVGETLIKARIESFLEVNKKDSSEVAEAGN